MFSDIPVFWLDNKLPTTLKHRTRNSRFSINISNYETVLKVQCEIQDIEGMLRVYQLKFNSGIKGIDVLGKL